MVRIRRLRTSILLGIFIAGYIYTFNALLAQEEGNYQREQAILEQMDRHAQIAERAEMEASLKELRALGVGSHWMSE
jgi:hypothetical protein